MPRGVKTDPNAPILVDGEWMVPVISTEYFADSEEFVTDDCEPFQPSVIIAGPRTGVYLIRGAGLVKIGLARCVRTRFQELQRTSPVTLTPAGFIPTPHNYRDAFALERQLHAQFAADRHHGEWFTETPALTVFMETHLAEWPIPHTH